MRNNSRRMSFAMFMLISLAILPLGIGMVNAPSQAFLEVDPRISVVAPGEAFSIDITVTNVTDLYAFQINMTFDPAVLNCTNVDEGPFLGTAGSTWWQDVTINNYDGWVFFGDSLFPAPPDGATGSGDLAMVTFNVVAEGESSMSFVSSSTKLRTLDEEGVTVPIDHTTVDGTFIYPLERDVAVTDVSPSSSSVTAGETVLLDVTVENKGNATETFDVTVSYDSTLIGAQTVTALAPEGSTALSFSWDTTGVAEGNYTIRAVVDPLSGETEISDNTHSVVITVTAPPSTIPTELVLGVILAALVASVIIAFLYVRRRRSTKA